QAPTGSKPKRPLALILVLGAAGAGLLLVVAGILAVAGFLYYRSSATGSGPAAIGQASFQKVAVTEAMADGTTVTDANGVALTAPSGSAETGDVLHMTSYTVSGELAQALANE